MLDDALLRPGRLEVQVEIGLPDEGGRHQILKAISLPSYHSSWPNCSSRALCYSVADLQSHSGCLKNINSVLGRLLSWEVPLKSHIVALHKTRNYG